jgi:outer membrane lipoprotein
MIRTHLRITLIISLILLWVYAAGCKPPFPKEAMERVNRSLTFRELRNDPDKYAGSWVLLGGMIVTAKNTKEGTLLEILQRPLDSDGRPLQTDATDGRFLLLSASFLDTAVYHPGRLITTIAESAGKRELPLDDVLYQYPFCTSRELHLWNPSSGPRFMFGVGFSGRM